MRYPILLLSASTLLACARPLPIVDESSPAPLPAASYLEAAKEGREVYRVLPHESLILVRVGRAGRMQRFGHEHAVASEDLQGFIEIDDVLSASRADIAFPLRDLIVDAPVYRERLKLDTQPSAGDIAGTYTNMLKVLEPAMHPWAEIRVGIVSGTLAQPQLQSSIVLHGHAFELLLPVVVTVTGDRIIACGSTVIRHSDFGLEPFSAVGGLLKVADELVIDFRIVGLRIADATGREQLRHGSTLSGSMKKLACTQENTPGAIR